MPGAGGNHGECETHTVSVLGSSSVLVSEKMEFLFFFFLVLNLLAFGSSWIFHFDLGIVNARGRSGICAPGISTLS